MLCLVANAASGAFGAIPVGVVDTLKLTCRSDGVSQTSTLTLAIINFFILSCLSYRRWFQRN